MRAPRLLGACLAASVLAAAAPARAVSVYVNSALVTSYTANATVGGFKYRMSNGSFDLSLDSGADTGGPAGSFLQANLGSHSFLNGRSYDFQFQHVVGEGFVLRMTDSSPGGATTVLSWGTFSSLPGGTNAPTLNGVAPVAAFNSLSLSAVASAANRSVVLSNLAFSSGALSVADGSFGAGTTTSVSSPGTQLLVADVDLSQFSWTLSGRVTLNRVSTGGDDTVRLRIGAVDATVTIVPEPAPAALASLGLLGLALYSRRRLPRP
jgi:hypothetical protein